MLLNLIFVKISFNWSFFGTYSMIWLSNITDILLLLFTWVSSYLIESLWIRIRFLWIHKRCCCRLCIFYDSFYKILWWGLLSFYVFSCRREIVIYIYVDIIVNKVVINSIQLLRDSILDLTSLPVLNDIFKHEETYSNLLLIKLSKINGIIVKLIFIPRLYWIWIHFSVRHMLIKFNVFL